MHLLRHPLRKHAAVSAAALLSAACMAGAPATQPATMPATEPSTQQPMELPRQTPPAPTRAGSDDLTRLSLEDLMNVEVTSVSRQKQRIADAPAAITVINQEDIQRSGITNLPDLMRLVPGMDVARVDANKWLVDARGNFSGLFADDLLVMMDGRTLYSPLFGGVFWDQQDYILQDLQRIEVIRGPGATLWGSNAVNGVINITTKDARDTQGWLINGLAGNQEQNAAVRLGGQIDDSTFFRVYGKFRNFDDFVTAADQDAHDGWQDYRGGFRVDRYASPHDTLTLQGDVYTSRQSEQVLVPVLGPPFASLTNDLYNSSGANVLARWKHEISDTADFSLQMYYDQFARDQAFFDYKQHIYDIDFQSRFALTKHQEIVWGFGGRLDTDRTEGGVFGAFIPPRQDNYLLSAFVQDGISIVPDRLVWFIGSKFEYNNYTHMEYQPSTRLLWTPDSHNTIWGAVSRAVRIPARWENSLSLNATDTPTPVGIPAQVQTVGNPSLKSEQLTSFELGYRVEPVKTVSFDLAAFFNHYDHMHSTEPLPTSFVATPTPHVLVPLIAGNNISGETFGAELAANWQVNPKWRLSGSYSFAQFQFHTKGLDPTTEASNENSSPRNQFQLHSYYDIMRNLQLNSSLYYVERTSGGATDGAAPSLFRADLSMTWRPRENLEITGGVANIFDDRHPEFGTSSVFMNSEVPRTYFGEVTWRF
jgi:iron complex outermembrane recepter protein